MSQELKSKKTEIAATNPASEEKSVEPAQPTAREAFTETAFLTHWQQFAEKLQAEGRQIEYLMLKDAPQFDMNSLQATIFLHNPIQQDRFQELRPRLQQHLRQQLQNSGIHVEGKFEEAPTQRMLYTNQEKFDYLAEQHPQLIELKQRLGLEPD